MRSAAGGSSPVAASSSPARPLRRPQKIEADGETDARRLDSRPAICANSGCFAGRLRHLRRFGGRAGPLAEEGHGPDRAVERRPAAARSELLLEPVEAA